MAYDSVETKTWYLVMQLLQEHGEKVVKILGRESYDDLWRDPHFVCRLSENLFKRAETFVRRTIGPGGIGNHCVEAARFLAKKRVTGSHPLPGQRKVLRRRESARLERARAEWRVLNSRLNASSPPWFPSGRDTPHCLRRPRFYHRHHCKM